MKLQKKKEKNFKIARGKQINYKGIVNTLTADILAATTEAKKSGMILFYVLKVIVNFLLCKLKQISKSRNKRELTKKKYIFHLRHY